MRFGPLTAGPNASRGAAADCRTALAASRDALTPTAICSAAPVPAIATNPDSEQGVLNVDLVLRWEYTLGSTLFVVYTRSQVPSVMLTPGEAASLGLGAVGRAPAAHVVLLKLSYFWAG